MNVEHKTITIMEENNNKNEQERKKMIQNYFYGDVKNVVNGDYFDYSTNEVEKKESPKVTMTSELLRQTVPSVQDRFWGNSSHAVVFCCCRDFYNYPNNMSQYERDMADPQNSLRLNYVCPEGTLAMAFANNPFLKLHVDKWKEYGVKSRVLKLVEEFRGKIEASNPDIHDDIK